MPRRLIDTIQDGDMIDYVYLEDDGTYFHDISYVEDDLDEEDTGEYYTEWSRAYPDKDYT